MIIQFPSGLGDAIYGYSIAKHYSKENDVTIKTSFPMVYDKLNVKTLPRRKKTKVDKVITYVHRREFPDTNQYEDMLISTADISIDLPMEFDFEDKSDLVINMDKPICLIKTPGCLRMHKRFKDFSGCPDPKIFQDFIDEHKNEYYFINVGKDEVKMRELKGIDVDLENRTTIYDLFRLVKISKFGLFQSCFLLPMFQAMKKKFRVVLPSKEQMMKCGKLQNFGYNKILFKHEMETHK